MYEVQILPAAKRQLKKLPKDIKLRILDRLQDLAIDARPPGAIKLEEQESLYRVRVSDYRIVYAIDDDQLFILVVKVGHRRDVYK